MLVCSYNGKYKRLSKYKNGGIIQYYFFCVPLHVIIRKAMNGYPDTNNNSCKRAGSYSSGYSYGSGRYDGEDRRIYNSTDYDDANDGGSYGHGNNGRYNKRRGGGNRDGIRGFYQKWPILSTLILMCVVSFFLLLGGLLFANWWTNHGETSTIPAVKGMPFDQAVNVLTAADLSVVVSDSIYDDSQPGGTVVEIWPKAGAVVKANREVYLTIVSYCQRMVVIDIPLTDISVKQAENYLASHGITSVRVEYVPGEFDNNVIAAKVGKDYVTIGSRIPANATVTLEVSRSEDPDLNAALDAAADSIYAEMPAETEEPATDPYYE